ncbi:MAG: porphobilinogen synthase, partial [Acetobacteraceae bacterium]|nr:porphobilinogen synthase [Acetobacteraceae bacterium]
MVPQFPLTRLRRLRATQAMRDLVQETTVSLNDLIYPIFVEEELDDFAPVESMPGIFRIPERKLGGAMKEIAAAGIKAVMTFGVSHHKDDHGGDTLREDGLLARMLKRAKDAAPELLVMSDTCFCEYTTHGHCGPIHDGDVHNDHTIEALARQAVIAAQAGADVIAPSAMMDGQIAAIRAALDGAGLTGVPIMAYSSKFASAFYGPFRAASGCDLQGDRKTYQMNPMNSREALRESLADEAEGADMLMVKPALAYLDIISQVRQSSLL